MLSEQNVDTNSVIQDKELVCKNVIKTDAEEANTIIETATENVDKIVETNNKESVSEITTKTSTLTEVILDFIAKDNNYKIKLNKETIDILKKIIGVSPTFLDDVKQLLLEVIKDGKIDSNDLPYLILLIQKLFEIIYTMNYTTLGTRTICVICAEVLKIIIYVLIREKTITIHEEKCDSFIKQIDLLIDSCIELLAFSNSIKVKGCFSSFFCKKNNK